MLQLQEVKSKRSAFDWFSQGANKSRCQSIKSPWWLFQSSARASNVARLAISVGSKSNRRRAGVSLLFQFGKALALRFSVTPRMKAQMFRMLRRARPPNLFQSPRSIRPCAAEKSGAAKNWSIGRCSVTVAAISTSASWLSTK